MSTEHLTNTEPEEAFPKGDRFGKAFLSGDMQALRSVSTFAVCLSPLLHALGWQGELRRVAEALPHFSDDFDIDDLMGVLARLRYECLSVKIVPRRFDPRLLPCLLVKHDGSPLVVFKQEGDDLEAFDGNQCCAISIRPSDLRGTAYYFSPVDKDVGAQTNGNGGGWVLSLFRTLRAPMWRTVGLVWMNSLIGLALPMFILLVYDWIIPTGSTEMLFTLAAGLVMVLVFDVALRIPRLRNMAFLGGRVDHQSGTQSFQQLLHLPMAFTNRAPLGAQMAQLKQFESLRDVFAGPIPGVFLEAPFAFIYLVALLWIAGDVAIIPLVLILIFAIATPLIGPLMKEAAAENSEARSQKQAFFTETLMYLRVIKGLGAEATWRERCRDLSARATISGFRAAQLTALVQAIAQALMVGAGFAVLVYGTMKVTAGEMSVGALVASMALVWRLLAPLQAGFLSIFKFEQLRQNVSQLNRLMQLKPERPPRRIATGHRNFRGEIAFQRVSMRYNQLGEPALLGVDLTVTPGEVLAITGPSGAGKSSILKLITGLYQPQAGAVLIDGVDVRQIDCADLRNVIAYVPQTCHIFYGSVAQNMRLSEPMATDETLYDAARDAGLLVDIEALPEGFDTHLNHKLQPLLPVGFRQRLMLARAYVRQSPFYLFDEPTNTLDPQAEALFIRKLDDLRQRATVIMVTHRPHLLQFVDRVVHLQGGRVVFNAPPKEALAFLGNE